MIPMPRLNLHKLRTPSRARLQFIRRLLKRRIQRSSNLPSQATTLTCFVFGKLARYVVEFGALSESR